MNRLRQLSTLQIALILSVLAHAALLGIRFVDPQRMERVFQDKALEVILVNARSDERPDQAQAIAQANLAGGGNLDEGRATSPLPPSPVARFGEALEEEERRIEAMKEQQNRLLAQLRDQIALLTASDPREAPETSLEERERRRQALVRTLAEIERRINEENARPRKRYISPATREAVYAVYHDELRRTIEAHGTANFPEVGGRRLYGDLTMVITVNHDGRVLQSEVVQTSGQPALDYRAQAIVTSLTFGRFNNDMRRLADQIVVASRFRFTREDGLQTRVQ